MNEQQIEDFEALVKKHFPRGALLAGFMPNGSLHTVFDFTDKDAEILLEYLANLITERVENLPDDEDWEDEPA